MRTVRRWAGRQQGIKEHEQFDAPHVLLQVGALESAEHYVHGILHLDDIAQPHDVVVAAIASGGVGRAWGGGGERGGKGWGAAGCGGFGQLASAGRAGCD